MLIWKQGKALPKQGNKIIRFNHRVQPGPADDRIVIADFSTQPDNDGNFIAGNGKGAYSETDLDTIHTFGVARYVLDIYEKIAGERMAWSWEKPDYSEPLSIYIRNNGINARYLKHAKCLELDHFGPYQNWTYYCHSTDIIAHEVAHAILDALQPGWEKGNTETRGLAEAFCDLAAMFFITTQFDLCEEVIRKNKGNLRRRSILTEFGVGLGEKPGMSVRSSLNNKIYRKDFLFAYEFAKVLTGCLYDILSDMMTGRKSDHPASCDALQLYEAGKIWQKAIFQTFRSCDPVNETLSGFRKILCSNLPDEEEIIVNRFSERGII